MPKSGIKRKHDEKPDDDAWDESMGTVIRKVKVPRQTALCLVHDTTGPHLEFENEVAENELIQEMATYLSQMRDLCAHLGGVCDVDKISKFRVVRTKLEERMDSLYDKIKHTRRKHTVLMAHANSSVCTCYSTEYNRAFADLPLEMTLRIFKYLDVFTLGKARQVCSSWNNIGNSPVLKKCVIIDPSTYPVFTKQGDPDFYLRRDWSKNVFTSETQHIIMREHVPESTLPADFWVANENENIWYQLQTSCVNLQKVTLVEVMTFAGRLINLPQSVEEVCLFDVDLVVDCSPWSDGFQNALIVRMSSAALKMSPEAAAFISSAVDLARTRERNIWKIIRTHVVAPQITRAKEQAILRFLRSDDGVRFRQSTDGNRLRACMDDWKFDSWWGINDKSTHPASAIDRQELRSFHPWTQHQLAGCVGEDDGSGTDTDSE